MTDSMTRHTDEIVVVGCGIAGLAAGVRAAELDRSVTVLEKAPETNRGGHTQFAESFRIPTGDIDVDADFNVPDYSTSDFYSDIMDVTEFRADNDLAERVATGAVDTFEWLTELGIEWEYRAPHPGYTAGRVWIDGEEMVAELVDILESRGVPSSTPPKQESCIGPTTAASRVWARESRASGRAMTGTQSSSPPATTAPARSDEPATTARATGI